MCTDNSFHCFSQMLFLKTIQSQSQLWLMLQNINFKALRWRYILNFKMIQVSIFRLELSYIWVCFYVIFDFTKQMKLSKLLTRNDLNQWLLTEMMMNMNQFSLFQTLLLNHCSISWMLLLLLISLHPYLKNDQLSLFWKI